MAEKRHRLPFGRFHKSSAHQHVHYLSGTQQCFAVTEPKEMVPIQLLRYAWSMNHLYSNP